MRNSTTEIFTLGHLIPQLIYVQVSEWCLPVAVNCAEGSAIADVLDELQKFVIDQNIWPGCVDVGIEDEDAIQPSDHSDEDSSTETRIRTYGCTRDWQGQGNC